MSQPIVVVGGQQEVVGFSLAGVTETINVETPGLADKLMEKEAVIFITQDARRKLADDLEEIRKKSIVQTIPETVGYSNLDEIIRKTIGFELKR